MKSKLTNQNKKTLEMKQIAIFILLLIGSIGFSQSLDCSKIKNGKFYHSEFPDRVTIRKDNIQENYNNGVLELVWNVIWTSECQFEIICTQSIGNSFIAVGDKIVGTITNIDNECYTCKRTFYSKVFPDGDQNPSTTFCFKK